MTGGYVHTVSPRDRQYSANACPSPEFAPVMNHTRGDIVCGVLLACLLVWVGPWDQQSRLPLLIYNPPSLPGDVFKNLSPLQKTRNSTQSAALIDPTAGEREFVGGERRCMYLKAIKQYGVVLYYICM